VTLRMRRLEVGLHHLVLGIFCLWILYPLLGVLELALFPNGSLLTSVQFPHSLTLDTVVRSWKFARFDRSLTNSAIVASSVTAGCVFLSTLAGYGFAKMRFVGSGVLFYVFVLGLVVPLETYVVPLYLELRDLGMLDSRIGLILPLLAQSLPFGVFWMRASFRALPQSLIDAARMDGASTLGVLRHVLVPLLRPAMLTLLVLTFVSTWNDFLLSLVVISSENMQTAPLSLALFIGQRTNDVTGLAAGALIISIPVVIVFVLFQRTLIRGILAGALKE
jgi:raffinose/stachyose/melibiose transport system permease protein